MSLDEDAKTLTDSQFEVSLGKVAPGTVVFGRYRLEKELGRGGMGVVWLAMDTRVEITVALKFLPDVVARDVESVEELKRELRRGLNLTHPSIVRVYSFEQDDSGAAIAMEYVDGPTLSNLKLKQPGSCFDCVELLPYLEQLCTALDYAHHEARIVHRDLKPRNLMLNSKGRLKIADFGVATSIAETISRSSMRSGGSGTPPYMSPQQAFGENPSPSDDIYSLGATIYELLTGRPPFYQGNILAQVQQRIPPSMNDRRAVLKISERAKIPDHWEKTVAACLAKHPEDRPQRAADVIDYLSGKRPPPVVEQTRESPIVPIVTLEDADKSPEEELHPRGGKYDAVGDDEDTVAIRSPRKGRESPSEFVPPSGRSRGAGWLVILVVVGAAIGLWKLQQQSDDQRTRTIGHENETKDVTAPGPDGANGAHPSATPFPKVDKTESVDAIPKQDEAVRQALLNDFERIAKGELPRRDAPWENSLRLRFLPVPGLSGLVAVHETRVSDYREFAVETRRPWTPTQLLQNDDHPAVNVSWEDARAFCEWLTAKERKEGRLGSQQKYRLPTDQEWSAAAGMKAETGTTPAERNGATLESYEWPATEAPVDRAGNLARAGETENPETEIPGPSDGFTHTAPVGRFKPNSLGLHDLAGNVAEWVEDWFDQAKAERTVRGGAWFRLNEHDLLTSFRWKLKATEIAEHVGFRVLLECGPMPQNLPPPIAPASPADEKLDGTTVPGPPASDLKPAPPVPRAAE